MNVGDSFCLLAILKSLLRVITIQLAFMIIILILEKKGFSAKLNNFGKILRNITKIWNHKTWLHTYSHLLFFLN